MKPWGRVFNIEILKVSVCDMAASGFARTFGGGLRRSTVAHFACKVRGTNIVAAKHAQKIQQGHAPDFATCPWPSLCLQSEGDEYSGGQARAKNLTRSCPRFSQRVRGPHFASKVSYSAIAPDFATCSWPSLCEQSELQCYRPRLRHMSVALALRAK